MEFLMLIGKVIGTIFILLMALGTWCLCVSSSKSSREEERRDAIKTMSELEKEVVDEVMEYHKSKNGIDK